MKVSITEARRKLPELVRKVKKDAHTRVQITVDGEVVAELRSCLHEARPGAAADRLLEIMSKHEPLKGPKRDISGDFKQHLYGKSEK
ncbi:MAG TPA: hypothetical protein VLU25_22370 [Acidobacteriota bacterium]|nr:hypothetical protein [Acidobacteriota bacterium]